MAQFVESLPADKHALTLVEAAQRLKLPAVADDAAVATVRALASDVRKVADTIVALCTPATTTAAALFAADAHAHEAAAWVTSCAALTRYERDDAAAARALAAIAAVLAPLDDEDDNSSNGTQSNTTKAHADGAGDAFAAQLHARRARLLMAVFELARPAEARAVLLAHLLRYASRATPSLAAQALSELPSIEALLREWNLSAHAARPLYRAANRLAAAAGRGRLALAFQVKYLATLDGQSNKEAQQAAALEAVEAARQAISLPGVWKCDHVLKLDAVAQLATQSEGARNLLHQLLSIVARGSLADYRSFRDEHGAAFDAAFGDAITHDALVVKMRCLTLASLAWQSPRLAYADVAKALDVDEDDVEEWVVRAVAGKALEAKLSQAKRQVVVHSVVPRYVDTAEWKRMHAQLGEWKSAVDQLLSTVQGARASAAAQTSLTSSQGN